MPTVWGSVTLSYLKRERFNMSTIAIGDVVTYTGPDPGWGPPRYGKVKGFDSTTVHFEEKPVLLESVIVELVAGGHRVYDKVGSAARWNINHCEVTTLPSKEALAQAYESVQARHEWESYARRTGQTVEQAKAPLYSAILGTPVQPKHVPDVERVSDVLGATPGFLRED